MGRGKRRRGADSTQEQRKRRGTNTRERGTQAPQRRGRPTQERGTSPVPPPHPRLSLTSDTSGSLGFRCVRHVAVLYYPRFNGVLSLAGHCYDAVRNLRPKFSATSAYHKLQFLERCALYAFLIVARTARSKLPKVYRESSWFMDALGALPGTLLPRFLLDFAEMVGDGEFKLPDGSRCCYAVPDYDGAAEFGALSTKGATSYFNHAVARRVLRNVLARGVFDSDDSDDDDWVVPDPPLWSAITASGAPVGPLAPLYLPESWLKKLIGFRSEPACGRRRQSLQAVRVVPDPGPGKRGLDFLFQHTLQYEGQYGMFEAFQRSGMECGRYAEPPLRGYATASAAPLYSAVYEEHDARTSLGTFYLESNLGVFDLAASLQARVFQPTRHPVLDATIYAEEMTGFYDPAVVSEPRGNSMRSLNVYSNFSFMSRLVQQTFSPATGR